MKWIRYIWIIMIFYLVCSARTCTENEEAAAKREEQYITELKDSVKHVFMSDSLSDQLLRAYEITAAEKLNDFADYLKIISDTSLDSNFRQQALKVAGNLLVNAKTGIEAWDRNDFKGANYWASPEQVIISTPFVRENDTTYAGSLSFYRKWISFSDPQQTGNLSGPHIINIYLVRSLKPFGNQQLRVWDVYLGEIK